MPYTYNTQVQTQFSLHLHNIPVVRNRNYIPLYIIYTFICMLACLLDYREILWRRFTLLSHACASSYTFCIVLCLCMTIVSSARWSSVVNASPYAQHIEYTLYPKAKPNKPICIHPAGTKSFTLLSNSVHGIRRTMSALAYSRWYANTIMMLAYGAFFRLSFCLCVGRACSETCRGTKSVRFAVTICRRNARTKFLLNIKCFCAHHKTRALEH